MPTATATIVTMVALGRRLRVAQWNVGEDADPVPLLIFSGIGMNLELIAPIADALAPRRVVAFDMPGVGGSPDPILPYNAVTMAATAAAVLDRLEIDRVDLLGISWGGGIAQQFALQHRPRVRRLALAATSAGVTMSPGSASVLARFLDPAEYTPARAFRRNLAMLYNGGGAGVPVSLNAATPPSPLGWLYQLGALAGWTSLPLLPLLDMPTLILAGEEDNVVPPLNARLLHAAIPNSRLRLFRGGGHLFMLSHLESFAETLEGFLSARVPVESA